MVAMTDVGRTNPAPTSAGSPHRRLRALLIVALVLSAATLILVVVSVVPALLVPAGQVPDAAQRLELQNAVRTTLLQGLGAVLLVAGAYFTWRQVQLGRDQLRQSLDTSTAQLQLSREGQITEQFSRAIEHLGHDKPGIRVGAIFALEQIAKLSPDLRAAIHELLAAYVRAESTWSHHDPVALACIGPTSGGRAIGVVVVGEVAWLTLGPLVEAPPVGVPERVRGSHVIVEVAAVAVRAQLVLEALNDAFDLVVVRPGFLNVHCGHHPSPSARSWRARACSVTRQTGRLSGLTKYDSPHGPVVSTR
jgi:hypothetical protein